MEKLPGYSYLYKTSSPDTVAVKLPAEGVLGVLGRKQEFFVTRGPNYADECARVLVSLPLWAVERGIYGKIENELDRWQAGWKS